MPASGGKIKTRLSLRSVNLWPTMASSNIIVITPHMAQPVTKATAVPRPAPDLKIAAITGKAI
jgi:hypothetical protein